MDSRGKSYIRPRIVDLIRRRAYRRVYALRVYDVWEIDIADDHRRIRIQAAAGMDYGRPRLIFVRLNPDASARGRNGPAHGSRLPDCADRAFTLSISFPGPDKPRRPS